MQTETAFPRDYFARGYWAAGYFGGVAETARNEAGGGRRLPAITPDFAQNDDDEVIMLAIQEFMRVLYV